MAEYESLLEILKNWQKLEDASVENSTKIIKRSTNPIVQLIMEIIRQDSVVHRRVQQMIIDNFEKAEFEITSEEIDELSEELAEHEEMERKVIDLARESLAKVDSGIVQYLLSYLLTDEEKHDRLLDELEKIKKT
ncbi:MAG: hypothetical protein ACM3U1_00665 [Chloroflexota bacterium]